MKPIFILLLLLALTAPFASCTLVETILSPFNNILRRGACVSVDVPPITLTPERTAAERQLIGEDKELEKNGWLIASSQNAGQEKLAGERNEEGADRLAKTRLYYRQLGVLEFYEEMVRDYKTGGLLGEGRDGLLRPVPPRLAPRTGKYRVQAEQENALRVAEEVNRARRRILLYRLEKEEAGAKREELEREMRLFHIRQSRPGDWIQNEKGAWERIK